MNERIKLLAKKAGIINRKFMFGEYYEDDLTDEQKKFAELILQDVRWVMQTAADDFILDKNYDAVKGVGRCMRRVKQHFGVTE